MTGSKRSGGAPLADEVWTDVELRASIEAYVKVLEAEHAGVQVSPTAIYRDLIAGPLPSRSEKAIGRRMSNLSAVFGGEGLPVAKRFSGSLTNVGSGVSRRILALYAELYGQTQPTADPAILAASVRKFRGHLTSPPSGVQVPSTYQVQTTAYVRDPAVCAFVLDRAKGVCEACDQPAPFQKADGEPFLEVHHLTPLAERGSDTVDNTIAACPNCHRRLHHSGDRFEFRKQIMDRLNLYRETGEPTEEHVGPDLE